MGAKNYTSNFIQRTIWNCPSACTAISQNYHNHNLVHRRYGLVDKRFCVEGGSRCGKGEGLFVFAAEGGRELTEILNMHSHDAQSRLSIASRSGSGKTLRF